MFRRKVLLRENLVEGDPTRYAFCAAFTAWSFGALADRSKPRGLVEEVAFGSKGAIATRRRNVRFAPANSSGQRNTF
jgi:hypothetical protein